MNDADVEYAHQILLERANGDYLKRISAKQKRFGKHHDNDDLIRERALVASLNRNALIALMGEHNILIPTRELQTWRPTEPVTGDIEGIQEALTIIATNGILGWYLTPDGQPWCGHIQCFSEKDDIKPLFKLSIKNDKVKKPRVRKKTKRQELIDSL